MTVEMSQLYCEAYGLDVKSNTNLKRFWKFSYYDEHMQKYDRAKQSGLGLSEQRREERRIRLGC